MIRELAWFKSSYSSGSEGDSCVEVAVLTLTPATIHIRDSKVADGPHLILAPTAWSEFVTYAAR